MANYSTRPERQARALVGFSAGAYGAMGLAIEHRDIFGSVVSLAGPINMRYSNCNDAYLDDFDPTEFTSIHVQNVVRATMGDRQGIGVVEQIALGPHHPTGLTGFLDGYRGQQRASKRC